MNHVLKPDKIEKFLKDFEAMNTSVILGLMILSVGLYALHWIFMLNKLLERHDKYAPDSNRGLSLLVILPFSWFFIMLFIKSLFTTSIPLIMTIFEWISWTLILYMVMKYLNELSHSFCDITNSTPIIWSSLFLFGLIGIVGVFTQTIYLYAFLLCIIFAIVGMQSELNSMLKSHTIRKIGRSYYKR